MVGDITDATEEPTRADFQIDISSVQYSKYLSLYPVIVHSSRLSSKKLRFIAGKGAIENDDWPDTE